MRCDHRDQIKLDLPGDDAKQDAVCEACQDIGGTWVHLRMCMTCGKIGCCDDSPNRHARAHAETDGHPIITSYEVGERWRYCFIDNKLV
ncbi:UBP-type zinc finger domain-containing protein [Ahrensia marina]|uniref:UBP-type zinc finger domain-containing protein n=1 Tax=Ahrensia marina TaxID=1514904 RepID=UPI0035CEDC38